MNFKKIRFNSSKKRVKIKINKKVKIKVFR